MKTILALTLTALTAAAQTTPTAQWAQFTRYADDNAKLGPPAPGENRVVFMGNSITDGWAHLFPTQFPGKPYIGRGISGQTTPQMLVRFRQDVIALHPKVVVILAGTNDIAGNTGPATVEEIEGNLASMAELARANGIGVVLCSILPVYDYPWRRGLEPAPKIMAINAWMKSYAASHGDVYADYHSAMQDARHGLPDSLAADGVHPNETGYRIMAGIVERAIAVALQQTPAASEHASACSVTDSAAADAVRARLAQWVSANNGGDVASARDVWAPNLAGWFPRATLFNDSSAFAAAGLRYSAHADSTRSSYDLAIQDVLARGDAVVVHDLWTETKRLPSNALARRTIRGSELWRCQPDGRWRIARFVSAPEPWSSASP